MIIRDGDWSLVEYDLHTKRQVWRRSNPDGTDTYRTDYHVDDVLADTHASRMDAMGRRHGDWTRIASVPIGMHYKHLAAAQAQKDKAYIDKWLERHSAFKTWR